MSGPFRVVQLDDAGRWWQVGKWEVDLDVDEVAYPPNVRACALAHRDGTDEEGQNLAALLDAQVESGETEPLMVVTGWLFVQSQRLVAKLWTGIGEQELKRAA